jgi:hypothetical protein
MTTTIIHGGLPPNVRDRDNVFGSKQDQTPQGKLLAARAKVKNLEHDHAEAQTTLRAAIDDDNNHYDFVALKANVHNFARQLEEAEAEASQWESVVSQVDKQNRRVRFDEALKEARQVRQKFEELYRDCSLQLGRWYRLGSEVHELANALADRMPTGHVYYTPELKNALAELDENPDPLHPLLDNGYSELQTSQSWRRHCAIVPLTKKEKPNVRE